MRSVLKDPDRAELCRRVGALPATAAPLWGRMTVGKMVSHLCLSARMALGELPVASKGRRAFQRFPLKHLILFVVPFPKGAPTARELLAPSSDSFDEERGRLRELLERLGSGPREGMGPAHPLLGPLTWQEWGVLVHKHSDHHLRQFGV